MINWQPISTAPLNGDYILVYDGFDIWKAFYMRRKWYCDSVDHQHQTPLFHEPTHWLPISDLLKPLGHL